MDEDLERLRENRKRFEKAKIDLGAFLHCARKCLVLWLTRWDRRTSEEAAGPIGERADV